MHRTRTARTVTVPARALPVAGEADVVVAGGGSAGFAAAVAAARAGARTILAERMGFLGGCLTGTYASQPGFFFDSEGRQIIRGVGWELMERLRRAGAAVLEEGSWYAQIFPEAVKDAALALVLEAGVDLRLHSWAGELLAERGTISALIVQSKSGRQAIEGKVFVDATGDADLAFLAGCPTEQLPPDELWQTSVDLTVCNVEAEKIVRWAKEHPERIGGWAELPEAIGAPGIHPAFSLVVLDGSPEAPDGSAVHVGPMPTVKLMIHPSISRVQGSVEIDGTDAGALTYAEIEARRRAYRHLEYLRRTVPGYENAIVIAESPLGVRETRRIVGEYVLTVEDLRSNARFPDVVALNCRALDRHTKGDVFRFDLLKGNHDIPYRALIPQRALNLLVAGRSISSDHEANSSLRGAATCLATGQAAGAAAALAARASGAVRAVASGELQAVLLEQGAILRS